MVKDNIQKGLQDISGTSAIIHKAIHFFYFWKHFSLVKTIHY